VVEVMSIRPENYAVELGRIVCPQILALTNVRPDHIAELGESLHVAARAFADGVPPGCQLMLLEGVMPRKQLLTLEQGGTHVLTVAPDAYSEAVSGLELPYAEWADNVRLALAVCEVAGVPPRTAVDGMRKVRSDFGALRAWRLTSGEGVWIAVNAFAANDPVSTMSVYRRVVEADPCRGLPVIGVLNVRGDRGDRTAQWCRVISSGSGPDLEWLFVIGDHPQPVVRRVRSRYGDHVQGVASRSPERVWNEVTGSVPTGGVVFGFGNIGGLGAALVEYWKEAGEPECLSSSLA